LRGWGSSRLMASASQEPVLTATLYRGVGGGQGVDPLQPIDRREEDRPKGHPLAVHFQTSGLGAGVPGRRSGRRRLRFEDPLPLRRPRSSAGEGQCWPSFSLSGWLRASLPGNPSLSLSIDVAACAAGSYSSTTMVGLGLGSQEKLDCIIHIHWPSPVVAAGLPSPVMMGGVRRSIPCRDRRQGTAHRRCGFRVSWCLRLIVEDAQAVEDRASGSGLRAD
jgi:hypothetical protein